VIVSMPPPFSLALFVNQFVERLPAFPFDQPRLRLYFRASNAIWHAVRLLRLSPDDHVLFPAYHCGLELDASLKAGARVTFYPVNRDTTIDPDIIRAHVNRRTKALYVIHYFGFSQDMAPIRDLCRESGLVLIEDCAQALYSRVGDRCVGVDGDLAIFSMWKSVPIPFGGALLVNSARLPLPDEGVPPGYLEAPRAIMKLLVFRWALHSRIVDWLLRKAVPGTRTWTHRLLTRKPMEGAEFVMKQSAWGIPPVSRRMILGADEREIVRCRRSHFEALLRAARGAAHVTPLFESLPDGVCPLFFPVLVEDSRQFSSYMESRGINAPRIWNRCHPHFRQQEFPDAAFLKSHVVALPVHQHLRRSDLDLIGDTLMEWERAHVATQTPQNGRTAS